MERAFATLADAAQRSTRWSIVYDQTARVIHWRTDQQDAVRFLRLSSVDFSCAAAPLSLDVHATVTGDVRPHLTTLTLEANTELIAGSSRRTSFTRRTTEDEVASQASYGFSASCAS